MGRRSSSSEDRRRRRRRHRSRSSSASSASSGAKSSASSRKKTKRRSRSRSRSSRGETSAKSGPTSSRRRSPAASRRSTSRDRRRRRSGSRDRKKPVPRSYRTSRSRSPSSPRRTKARRHRSRSLSPPRRHRKMSSSPPPPPPNDRLEVFGKPLPVKKEESDDEETKLAKENARKKTEAAVFDLKADSESHDRQLAEIEGEGFHQSTFKSSRSDKKRIDPEQDDPVNVAKTMEKSEVKSEVSPSSSQSFIEKLFNVRLPANLSGVDLTTLAAHPSLYEDPVLRERRWKKKWAEMRRLKLEALTERSASTNPAL